MREKKVFHFKKFSVQHDGATMKVGTDGVLLGAWTDVTNTRHLLDVGTGSGVVALMLAQRTHDDATIEGVEIQEQDAAIALQNVNASPWSERIKIHHTSIQDFEPPYQYDLIVSNPPYFNNSLTSPDNSRTTARHTNSLTFTDLLLTAKRLLHSTGRLSIILPYQESKQFCELTAQYGLSCIRKMEVRTRVGKPVERVLMEFGQQLKPVESSEMIIHSATDKWSEEYKDLTREFYLKL